MKMKFTNPFIVLFLTTGTVEAFAPSPLFHHKNVKCNYNLHDDNNPKTTLFATQKKKQSMADKRKKRGKRFTPKTLVKPSILETIPNPDEWTKPMSTEEQISAMKTREKEGEKAKTQAAKLIETQRKSVEVLSYVRQKVEELPLVEIARSMTSSSPYHVVDNFMGKELSSEMRNESLTLLDNNKMDLDLKAGLCSGEYAMAIKGGVDQYAECPRSTEFVVSLTRHLTASINKVDKDEESITSLGYELDESASMAGMRTFSRSARVSSLSLLTGKAVNELAENNENLDETPKREFQYVVDNESNEVDYRKITVMYYLTSESWDKECGGGVTILSGSDNDNEEKYVDAKNDRLLILNSESCLHQMEGWNGSVENGNGSMIITHLVQKISTSNVKTSV
mmetsp:Transcript_10250/g.12970  ORF Transcript_10250/g.12970 Transcript_10250/m.12970 type:complete len:395 (-) Transcript_10250:42-1226(-)